MIESYINGVNVSYLLSHIFSPTIRKEVLDWAELNDPVYSKILEIYKDLVNPNQLLEMLLVGMICSKEDINYRLTISNNQYIITDKTITCPGCGRAEVHKSCPAYGTEYYMSGQLFTK